MYRQFTGFSVPGLATVTESGATGLYTDKQCAKQGMAMPLCPLSAAPTLAGSPRSSYRTTCYHGTPKPVPDTLRTRIASDTIILATIKPEHKLDSLFGQSDDSK